MKLLRNKKATAYVDAVCKRYGVLPSELLKLGLDDFSTNLAVFRVGLDQDLKSVRHGE